MTAPIQGGAQQQVPPNIKKQHREAKQPVSRIAQIVFADQQAVQAGNLPLARNLLLEANHK